MQAAKSDKPALKKRTVFYLMGFDPRSPDFYHSLLRREARASSKRGFGRFEVGPLKSAWAFGQDCECRSVNTPDLAIRYEFMTISDITAKYCGASLLWYFWAALHLFFAIFGTGFTLMNLRHARRFALFTFYPFIVLFATAAVAMGLGWALATGLSLDLLAQAGIDAAIFLLLTLVLRRSDQHHHLFYLIGNFAFTHSAVTDRQPALHARMQEFAQRIEAALWAAAEDEEVLIVGHSSGALLAIQLAATISRRVPQLQASRMAVLTLANQANLGFFPHTQRFRKDVARLAGAPGPTWCDVYAPQDLISAGHFDPAARLVPQSPHGNLSMHGAQFVEACAPASYAKIRYAFFKLHMQYLRASETGKGFNYFAVLGSPDRLADTLRS